MTRNRTPNRVAFAFKHSPEGLESTRRSSAVRRFLEGIMDQALPPPPIVRGVEIRHSPSHPGYAVGDDGSTWSAWTQRGTGQGNAPIRYIGTKWRRLVARPNQYGHLRITVKENGRRVDRYVHRLVLEAFDGPCPEGMECRHFPDDTKSNCRRDNLIWGTRMENVGDMREHGTMLLGEAKVNAILTEGDVRQIRALRGTMFQKDIALKFGVSRSAVLNILRGTTWKHVQ